jgi:sterol desaturase/sphingolipid hydroxylase (fatty acid hydroxylase superfamily)
MSYILSFIAGAIFWSLAEYLLHRFLGHSLHIVKLKTKFYKEHANHHFIKNYYASATDKILSCVAFGPIVFIGTFFIIGPMNAFIFTGGFLSMYMVYEIIHYRLHAVAPTHFFAAKMRAHHFFHHYGDPSKNHGVTSFFWDYVFGTYVKDAHIKFRSNTRSDGFRSAELVRLAKTAMGINTHSKPVTMGLCPISNSWISLKRFRMN